MFLETKPNLEALAHLEAGDMRGGGIQHLPLNDDVAVRDILHASLVGSDNTATAALVRLSGIPAGDFIGKMNEKAAAIGMRQTTFMDEAGLSPDNRSIASDIVKLIDEALRVDEIRLSTEMPALVIEGASGRRYAVPSTNELLDSFLNQEPYRVVGGKTGFLPEAGYCFGAVVSEGGGREIIVVVLGSKTKEGRFQDAKALAAWAYKVFDWPDQLAAAL